MPKKKPTIKDVDGGSDAKHELGLQAAAGEVNVGWLAAFARILGSEELCDVSFVVGGERLLALRGLCAAHSPVLAMLFGDDWNREPGGGEIDVAAHIQMARAAVTADTFRPVLQWIHTGRTTLTPATFIGVLNLASYLQINALGEHCGEWIAQELNIANVAEMLEEALALKEESLAATCMALVEAQTEEVLAHEGFDETVTEETLTRIMASPLLNVEEEITLYSAVVRWGEAQLAQQQNGLPLATIVEKPMAEVRLGLIPTAVLSSTVRPAMLAQKDAIIDALLFQAGGADVVPNPASPQLTKRTGTRIAQQLNLQFGFCNSLTGMGTSTCEKVDAPGGHTPAIGASPIVISGGGAVFWKATVDMATKGWVFLGIIAAAAPAAGTSYGDPTCYGWATNEQVYIRGANVGKSTQAHEGWVDFRNGDVAIFKLQKESLSMRVKRFGGKVFTLATNGEQPFYIHANLHQVGTKVTLSTVSKGEEF